MEWLCLRCGLSVDDKDITMTEEVEVTDKVLCKNCNEPMEPQ
jgi:DNA-directed RNA polymerase subunit RPC12/RpoP